MYLVVRTGSWCRQPSDGSIPLDSIRRPSRSWIQTFEETTKRRSSCLQVEHLQRVIPAPTLVIAAYIRVRISHIQALYKFACVYRLVTLYIKTWLRGATWLVPLKMASLWHWAETGLWVASNGQTARVRQPYSTYIMVRKRGRFPMACHWVWLSIPIGKI